MKLRPYQLAAKANVIQKELVLNGGDYMCCEKCGSRAINHDLHGRDGSDPDLCDVCYWRKRAVPKLQPIKNVKRNTGGYILVALRRYPYRLEPVYWKNTCWCSAGGMMGYVDDDIVGYLPLPEFEQ